MEQLLASIEKPTLILDKSKTLHNIDRMALKAQKNGVRFRPHFKTHQSAEIGEWFRERGVDSITVSSVDMAGYFINHGWRDITIAFPCNLRQVPKIGEFARRARLGILVESVEVVRAVDRALTRDVDLWLKVDAG